MTPAGTKPQVGSPTIRRSYAPNSAAVIVAHVVSGTTVTVKPAAAAICSSWLGAPETEPPLMSANRSAAEADPPGDAVIPTEVTKIATPKMSARARADLTTFIPSSFMLGFVFRVELLRAIPQDHWHPPGCKVADSDEPTVTSTGTLWFNSVANIALTIDRCQHLFQEFLSATAARRPETSDSAD